MTTTTSWISKKPDRCGGDACIRDTRITVWGLMEWRRLGLTDARILQIVQGLTPADLDAAWEYTASHPEEIEEARADGVDADAFGGPLAGQKLRQIEDRGFGRRVSDHARQRQDRR